MNDNNGVSIIICCYNSSKRIATTLEHLQRIKSNGISWEVILVDNRSDDDTLEKSVKIWNTNPVTKLITVTENKRGLMNARITGVKNSSYDIVSFIDDDNWIEEKWVEKVYNILQNDRTIVACGGTSEGVFESTPPSWFSKFTFYYAVGKQQEKTGYVCNDKGYLWGAGLTLRKKEWNKLYENEFNNLLKGRTGKALTAGEDSEICFALILRGWKLWYDESLKFKHFIPTERLSLFYLMKIYDGFGKAAVVLSLYVDAISGKVTNKSSWLLQCFASFKIMLKSGIRKVFSSKEDSIKNKAVWRYDKAYFFELIDNRNKFEEAKKQIQSFDKTVENKIVATAFA